MNIILNEWQVSRLIGLLRESESDRVDKYGNPIPRNGQGYGPDPDNPNMRNRQGYNADGSKGPWFSRSVAVATAVLLKDKDSGRWYILAGQRGNGTPDYQGYWNLPCGYLDYNEDTQDAAVREVFEETGIRLDKSQLKSFGSSSSPYENRQNVVFFYVAILNESTSSLPFSTENMEDEEVSGLQWLPIDKCGTLRWAFDHDELINKILTKYSHLIKRNKEENLSDREKISKVIDLLQNGGDTEYAVEILKTLM